MLLNSSFRENSFSDICYIRVYDISSSIDTGSCSRDIKCIFLYNRWNRSFFKILHWRRVDRHSLNHIEIFVIILLAYNNINISTHETEEEKRKKKKRERFETETISNFPRENIFHQYFYSAVIFQPL